jgi:WD40 repeat protein
VADVFMSYSRRDSDFVRAVADALQASGKDVWVDVEGIRDGEVFPKALRAAVESSDSFVFVISPDAVASTFCAQEVDHAVELGKRIIPVVHRRVADEEVPEPIRERNWIPFDDGASFDAGLERLVVALDTDLDHVKAHTRWLVKAIEWEAAKRDGSSLLRGAELAAAEAWLRDAGGKAPEPTTLQHEYIYASRAAATRRLRILAAAMAFAFAVSIALAVVALTQRNAARHQSRVASSRELAAVSENQLPVDPELAALIGIEAVKRNATPQAQLALREALDALSLRRTLIGHRDVVTSTAFSPDGKLLASSSPGAGDMSVRVWNVRSGRQMVVIYPNGTPQRGSHPPGIKRGPPGGRKPHFLKKGQLPPGANHGRAFPNYVIFSPDGKRLLVALDTGGLAIYTTSGKLLQRVGGPNSHFNRIHFAAGGRLALVSGVGPPVLANALTDKPLRAFPFAGGNDQIQDSDISPDGRFMAMAATSGYVLANARTGALITRIGGSIGNAVAFSPRAPLLAFGGHNGRIALLDARSGRRVRTLANVYPAGPNQIAWSPDGKRVAAALTDGTARIWNAANGQELERFTGHRCCVIAVAFSPDGKLLATGAEDHKVNVWSSNGNALASLQAGKHSVTGLAFTGAGRLAVTASGQTMLWQPGRRPVQVRSPAATHGVVASADGRTLAVAGGNRQAALVDAASGRVERTLAVGASVRAVALDSRQRLLAAATAHGAHVYSLADGRQVNVIDQPLPVSGVDFDPMRNGLLESLSDVGQQGGGALWLESLGSRGLLGAATSPGPFTAARFSPDGTLLAAVARADPGVRIYDSRMHELRELLGHVSDVNALAWAADGRYLITGGADGTVRMWEPASGTEIRIIRHGTPISAVAMSRDGRRLAFGDSDGLVQVWTGCPGCGGPKSLLALATRGVTRQLSPLERRTFLIHQ